MFDAILPIYNFFPGYVQKLVEDLPEERMCEQPVPGQAMNHAAWTLAHLAYVNDAIAGMLGAGSANPPEWRELYGPGSKPVDDRTKYPSKADLLSAVEAAHKRLGDAAVKATPDVLAGLPPERLRKRFATVGDMVAALMTAHYASHIGQLSAWRRAIGLPGVF